MQRRIAQRGPRGAGHRPIGPAAAAAAGQGRSAAANLALTLEPSAVIGGAAELGLNLSIAQAELLVAFAGLLLRWNRAHNLTAISEPGAVLSHHLLDSLAIVPAIAAFGAELKLSRPLRVLDVGAGAGLPGVPVAIAMPQVEVVLIDKVHKKVAFLQHVRTELALANMQPVAGRVESWVPAVGFDLVVSRAFSSVTDFVRMTRHVLAPAGAWLAMKGRAPAAELAALDGTVQVVRIASLQVPTLAEERHLIQLRPIGDTK